MQNHSDPLAVFMAVLFAGGAAFMMWRTVVALRTGSIWLRGQHLARSEDPVWFWAYLTTYLVVLAGMIYGVCQAMRL
jgi:hypothetical protein